jgi:predicted lipoprotein
LATSFTQFEEAKNTIDFAQILHSLDEVPARQKRFLIDA